MVALWQFIPFPMQDRQVQFSVLLAIKNLFQMSLGYQFHYKYTTGNA